MSYKEDIIQIDFGKSLVVDIGFYPEFEPDGFFLVVVILNRDWENPVYKKQCKTLEEMRKCLQEAIDIADSLSHGKI